jgi:hypothetical protein
MLGLSVLRFQSAPDGTLLNGPAVTVVSKATPLWEPTPHLPVVECLAKCEA